MMIRMVYNLCRTSNKPGDGRHQTNLVQLYSYYSYPNTQVIYCVRQLGAENQNDFNSTNSRQVVPMGV